jgi:glycosyltransferase involved in cell wall biosynthesis
MVRFALATLRGAGHEPVVAWYEHYSRSPALSVPLWALPVRRPGVRREALPGGGDAAAIGAWLPELEFTHYLPTRRWRELADSCDAYLAVSGNCLAATPFALLGRPFVAWVASAWDEDRRDRVRGFPAARRAFDWGLVRPAARRLERRILRAGTIRAISGHTARSLGAIAGTVPPPLLPTPVDTDAILPRPGAVVPGRVGFAGRLDDPRKNVDLLLDAIAAARAGGAGVTGLLLGAADPARWEARVAARGLQGAVEVVPYLERHEELVARLQTLDCFVIPSHQEGLCIAALEAMACGAPVVSTRCGGPEDFVVDGETGFWTASEPGAMAEAIVRVVGFRGRREALSAAACALVERRFAAAACERTLLSALRATFPGLGA